MLGIVREMPHIPYFCCELNVIPKSDFDAADRIRRNRLRILLDQRALNMYLKPPKFRNETLNRARGMFRPGDVMLCFDMPSFFYTFAMASAHQEFMGCCLGDDGPLGNRNFVWCAAPMGV